MGRKYLGEKKGSRSNYLRGCAPGDGLHSGAGSEMGRKGRRKSLRHGDCHQKRNQISPVSDTAPFLVCIFERNDYSSDLTPEHLPLLENILEKSLKTIEEKYGVGSNQILAYLHYQPSYYHLHIHFVHLKWQAPGSGAGKAHLLTAVIENIRRTGDYYQSVTLPSIMKANDTLALKYKEAGIIKC